MNHRVSRYAALVDQLIDDILLSKRPLSRGNLTHKLRQQGFNNIYPWRIIESDPRIRSYVHRNNKIYYTRKV